MAHAPISFKEVQFLGAGSLISCERVNVRKQCMLLKYPSWQLTLDVYLRVHVCI
jgi:hypothetical protein